MNEFQLKAVNFDTNCVITACLGSGKTTVLVNKAKRILSNSNHYLIGVTFSKNSADELGERLIQLCGPSVVTQFKTGTFHSLAKRQLESYYGGKKLRILANHERNLILRDLYNSMGSDRKYQDFVMQIDVFKSTTQPDMEDDDYRIFVEYQKILKGRQVYEFSDMILESVALMQSGKMKPLYATHMMVDEFQDTDQSQYEWVKQNATLSKMITTVVGDDDQTIYGFRSAQGYHGMMQFKEEYKATLISLPINYRCAPEILNPAAKLITRNTSRVDKNIQAHKQPGGKVDVKNFATRDNELTEMMSILLNENPNEWAILGRTNKVLDIVELYLNDEGIECQRTKGDSFWEKRSTGVFLGTLTSLFKDDWTMLASTLQFIGIPHSLTEKLRSVDENQWHLIVEKTQTQNSEKMSKTVQDFVAKRKLWRQLLQDFQVNSVCMLAEKYLKDFAYEGEQDLLKYARKSLQKKKGSLQQRVAQVKLKKESKDQPSGVYITTMHGSKGLEFEKVWIVAAEDGESPLKDEPIEEERRLFYVAMTRAKQHLVISYSDSEGEMSPFLSESALIR